jgi:hypothetical protein
MANEIAVLTKEATTLLMELWNLLGSAEDLLRLDDAAPAKEATRDMLLGLNSPIAQAGEMIGVLVDSAVFCPELFLLYRLTAQRYGKVKRLLGGV